MTLRSRYAPRDLHGTVSPGVNMLADRVHCSTVTQTAKRIGEGVMHNRKLLQQVGQIPSSIKA
jgi:hypothetical protein